MRKIFSSIGGFGIAIGLILIITFPYFAIFAIFGYMFLEERKKGK